MAQTVKCLPTMQETWVQSLGREDLLEKEMATHSSIPTWRIPWTEELGGLQSTGSQRVGHNWQLTHPPTPNTPLGMTNSNFLSKRIVPVTGSLALNLTCSVTLTCLIICTIHYFHPLFPSFHLLMVQSCLMWGDSLNPGLTVPCVSFIFSFMDCTSI